MSSIWAARYNERQKFRRKICNFMTRFFVYSTMISWEINNFFFLFEKHLRCASIALNHATCTAWMHAAENIKKYTYTIHTHTHTRTHARTHTLTAIMLAFQSHMNTFGETFAATFYSFYVSPALLYLLCFFLHNISVFFCFFVF